MAVTHYTLFNGSSFSLKGDEYDITIYSKYRLTGAGNIPMTNNENRPFVMSDIQLNYDTAEQEKFSPIISSKFSMNVVVSDVIDYGAMAQFLGHLRDVWEEGDVTIGIERNQETFWMGVLLIDLGAAEDTVEPYEVRLTATDGIGLLKNYDMVVNQSNNPYDPAETYINTGYKNIVYWLTEILKKCRIPGPDESSNNIQPYKLQISAKWAYENQNLGVNDCPLQWTTIQMLGSYALQDGGLYKCPTVYSVLETLCKMWNARIVFWCGNFYFTQLNEFNTVESGTAGNPINIFTTEYDINGNYLSVRDGINVNEDNGAYQQDISFGNTGGLQRMSGANFTYQPQVKRVEANFDSFVGNEAYYQGFPEVWDIADVNSSSGDQFKTTSLGTHYNASTFGGFICKFLCDVTFINNGTDPDSSMILQNFALRAKPVGGTYAAGQAKWCVFGPPTAAGLVGDWIDYPSVSGGQLDFEYQMGVPTSPVGYNWWQQVGWMINGFNVGTTYDFPWYDNTIQTHSDFIGDWEFEIVMHGRKKPLAAGNPNSYFFMGVQLYMVFPIPGAPTEFMALYPWEYADQSITWVDSMDYTTNPATFKGLFQPYSSGASSSGSTSTLTQVSSTTKDTEIKRVEPIIWGDTITYGESNSIIFQDTGGNPDGYTDPNGLWGETQAGPFDKTIVELICQDRLNNMAVSSENMNGTIVASIFNPQTAFGVNLFINPIGILIDTNDAVGYQFSRGTYKLDLDEVEGEWMQISTEVVVSTTTNTGSGSGNGGADNPPPPQNMVIPGGNTSNINPLNAVLTFSNSNIPPSTISSFPIDSYYGSLIMFAGDVIEVSSRLSGGISTVEMRLTADVEEGDTSISITETTLLNGITKGSPLKFGKQDQILQTNRKTHGRVADFEISDNGIKKDGINITTWLNDCTFSTASANSLATSESIKCYVDNLPKNDFQETSHSYRASYRFEGKPGKPAPNGWILNPTSVSFPFVHGINLNSISATITTSSFNAINGAVHIVNTDTPELIKWNGNMISVNGAAGTLALYKVKLDCNEREPLNYNLTQIAKYNFRLNPSIVGCWDITLNIQLALGELIIPILSMDEGTELAYVNNLRLKQS